MAVGSHGGVRGGCSGHGEGVGFCAECGAAGGQAGEFLAPEVLGLGGVESGGQAAGEGVA